MVSLISSHLSLLSLSLFPYVGAPMSGSRQRLQQLEAGVNLGGASCTTKQEAEQNSILFTSDKKYLRGARTLSRLAEALQVCLAAAGKKTLSTRSLKNSHVSRFGNARENLLVLHQISYKGLVRATPFHPRRVHALRTPTWTLKHTNHGTTKLKMFFTRCLVRVVSSPIALCDDLRCDNGHALLSGMMVLASLRVMHRVMIPCASSPPSPPLFFGRDEAWATLAWTQAAGATPRVRGEFGNYTLGWLWLPLGEREGGPLFHLFHYQQRRTLVCWQVENQQEKVEVGRLRDRIFQAPAQHRKFACSVEAHMGHVTPQVHKTTSQHDTTPRKHARVGAMISCLILETRFTLVGSRRTPTELHEGRLWVAHSNSQRDACHNMVADPLVAHITARTRPTRTTTLTTTASALGTGGSTHSVQKVVAVLTRVAGQRDGRR